MKTACSESINVFFSFCVCFSFIDSARFVVGRRVDCIQLLSFVGRGVDDVVS